MITINFVEGTRRRVSAPGTGFILYIGSLGIVMGICGYFYVSLASVVTSLEERKEQIDIRVSTLREKTKEVEGLDATKQEVRKKLIVVASLKKKKRGPAHLLDDVNLALPERSWLTEINEKSGSMQINGKALDNQTVSEFMRKLGESSFLAGVDLNESKQDTVDGVKIQAFSVRARAMYGGKDLPDTDTLIASVDAAGAGQAADKKPNAPNK